MFGWQLAPAIGLPLAVMSLLWVGVGWLENPDETLTQARRAGLEETRGEEAAALYGEFLRKWPDHEDASRASAELAGVQARVFGNVDAAIESLLLAEALDVSHVQSGEWMLEAGEFAEQRGEHNRARRIWESAVERHPELRAPVTLRWARSLLAEGESGLAFESFQNVALLPRASQAQRSLARMGMSICLERLGDLESALAELDEVGDAHLEEARTQRRQHLQDRQEGTTTRPW